MSSRFACAHDATRSGQAVRACCTLHRVHRPLYAVASTRRCRLLRCMRREYTRAALPAAVRCERGLKPADLLLVRFRLALNAIPPLRRDVRVTLACSQTVSRRMQQGGATRNNRHVATNAAAGGGGGQSHRACEAPPPPPPQRHMACEVRRRRHAGTATHTCTKEALAAARADAERRGTGAAGMSEGLNGDGPSDRRESGQSGSATLSPVHVERTTIARTDAARPDPRCASRPQISAETSQAGTSQLAADPDERWAPRALSMAALVGPAAADGSDEGGEGRLEPAVVGAACGAAQPKVRGVRTGDCCALSRARRALVRMGVVRRCITRRGTRGDTPSAAVCIVGVGQCRRPVRALLRTQRPRAAALA